jgi:hypothetical protein
VRLAAVPVALALAGAAIVLFGGDSTAATAVGVALLGFAGVAAMALVFYAVGRAEDRDRAAAEFARRAAAREAAAAPEPPPAESQHPHPQPHPPAAHGEVARARRRPRPPRRPR